MATKPTTVPRWARTVGDVDATNLTIPSSGQQDTGWPNGVNPVSSGIWNWLANNVYQWVLYLRDAAVVGLFAEDFEATAFPPTARPGWSTPSPRFGTDLSWVRSTTNPITGTASASAPVP